MKAVILTDPQVEIDGNSAEVVEVIKAIQGNKQSAEPVNHVKTKQPYRKSKPKKAKKSGKGKVKTPWTKEDIALLIRGYNDKSSFTELAELTGHPVSAVRTRVVNMLNSGELKNKSKE